MALACASINLSQRQTWEGGLEQVGVPLGSRTSLDAGWRAPLEEELTKHDSGKCRTTIFELVVTVPFECQR